MMMQCAVVRKPPLQLVEGDQSRITNQIWSAPKPTRAGLVLSSKRRVFCVVHLLSKGVPSREDTFLSWHLAPVSEVTRGLTLPF
jgi:hypothetical protein